MSDMNVGDSGVKGAFPLPPSSMTQEVKGEKEVGYSGQSTLSTSELSELSKSVIPQYPEHPLLIFPQYMPTDLEELYQVVAMKFESIKHDIISDMWDSYQETNKQIEEQRQDYLKSPQYQAFLEQQSPTYIAKMEAEGNPVMRIRSSRDFQSYLKELSPQIRETEESITARESIRLGIQGLADYSLSKVSESDAIPAFSIVASFAIGASLMGDIAPVVDVASTSMVGVNPITDMGYNPMLQMVPSDMRAELGLLGAMMSATMVYQTTAEGIAGGGPGTKPLDIDFAKGYAKNVIKLAGSDEFRESTMAVLVHRFALSGPVSEERRGQLFNMARILMLMNALALVYKVQYGGITGKELVDMVEGKTKAEKGDIKGDLVKYIQGLLKGLPSEERAGALAAIEAYGWSNPKVEHMLDPTRVFYSVLGSSNFERTLINEKPI